MNDNPQNPFTSTPFKIAIAILALLFGLAFLNAVGKSLAHDGPPLAAPVIEIAEGKKTCASGASTLDDIVALNDDYYDKRPELGRWHLVPMLMPGSEVSVLFSFAEREPFVSAWLLVAGCLVAQNPYIPMREHYLEEITGKTRAQLFPKEVDG